MHGLWVYIICISAPFDVLKYANMLKMHGTYCIVVLLVLYNCTMIGYPIDMLIV